MKICIMILGLISMKNSPNKETKTTIYYFRRFNCIERQTHSYLLYDQVMTGVQIHQKAGRS